MSNHNQLKAIFYLSVLGTAFASIVTWRSVIAPSSTHGIFSCVGLKVLGWSPCPYGLTIFTLLTVLSGLIISGHLLITTKNYWLFNGVAWLGVVFAGWVGYRELILPALARGNDYWQNFNPWAVPACVWGFFVFLAVAILMITVKPATPTIN